jgi:hypothetical protein
MVARPGSIPGMKEVPSMPGDGVDHLCNICVEQQHTDGDSRYAISGLTMGADANQPSSTSQRVPRPAQFNIDNFATVGIDLAECLDFVPRNPPFHQAPIKDPAGVNRKYNEIRRDAATEVVNDNADADQTRET